MWRVNVVVKCKNGSSPTVFRRTYLRETQERAKKAGESFHESIKQTGQEVLDYEIETERS